MFKICPAGLSHYAGLFGAANGVPEGAGLLDPDLDASFSASGNNRFPVGGLAGNTESLIRSSFVTGTIDTMASGNGAYVHAGGLAGRVGRSSTTRGVSACRTDVEIDLAATATAGGMGYVGGLARAVAGTSGSPVSVTATYATGDVTANRSGAAVGGLPGRMGSGTVGASYSTGVLTATGGGGSGRLTGNTASSPTITVSYRDTAASGVAVTATGHHGAGYWRVAVPGSGIRYCQLTQTYAIC